MKNILPILVLGLMHSQSSKSSSCDIQSKEILGIHPPCNSALNAGEVSIDADSFLPVGENKIKVSGNVCIQMQDQTVLADELLYQDDIQQVEIFKPFTYIDSTQRVEAESAFIQLQKEELDLKSLSYVLKETKANGDASGLQVKDKISYLQNLTYSTCLEEQKDWFVKAESAELDSENQVGTFRKMTLRFKNVPLLYLPYAKLPLNDQRKSGFLIPSIGYSSRNGFDLAVPYYFNIAENRDATITPRIMTDRGFMLATEFRYLGENYQGDFFADYLANDKVDDKDRGYAEFNHRHRLNDQWSINTRLNHVSDRRYFEDFGNNVYSTSRSFLYSFLDLNGFGDSWRFKGQFNDYQVISDLINLQQQPYQKLPALNYSWFGHNYQNGLNYGVDAEWVSFYREDSITADRLDIKPYIQKHFQNSWSRLSPMLAWRHTEWSYSDQEYTEQTEFKKQRSQPIFSMDYELSFEKSFADGSYKTLEPRLFYLYSPFKDQTNIPLFDTHNLTYGVHQLFQTNTFSGADRQVDANQLSLALTQRHISSTGEELWNFTVGQIHYFDDIEVNLNDVITDRRSSPLIAEFNHFHNNWRTTAAVHWDSEESEMERALLKFQRKGKNNSLFNFAYRFRKGKIEQLDSSVVLPFHQKYRFIARWNYSLESNSTIEALAGLEFKSCCWATRLVARRNVYNEQGDSKSGIYFELELNGLGSLGRNPRRLLKQSILGYSEEY